MPTSNASATPTAIGLQRPHLCVQICALNEQESIGQVIHGIPRAIDGVSRVTVVVINDGSTDNTVPVALQAGADHIVHHSRNRGLARSFQDGTDACLELGADIIVNIDADGQYPPASIPALIAPILSGKADLVIGDRQVDVLAHFSPLKRALERLGSWTVQVASGIRTPDAVSGFRAYSREAALRLFVTSKFSYTVQTLIQAGKTGLAVASVPIQARETRRPSRLHRGMWHFISQQSLIILRTYATYEPFKTFMLAASPFLLVGAILLARLMVIASQQGGQLTGHVQSLIVGTVAIVLGLLLGVTGIVADRIRDNRQYLEEILYRQRSNASRQDRPS